MTLQGGQRSHDHGGVHAGGAGLTVEAAEAAEPVGGEELLLRRVQLWEPLDQQQQGLHVTDAQEPDGGVLTLHRLRARTGTRQHRQTEDKDAGNVTDKTAER